MTGNGTDFGKWRTRVGAALHTLQFLTRPDNVEEFTWYALSVKAKEPSHSIWLAIAKRYSQNGWEVAFNEDSTPDGALTGIIERELSGSLKWHHDKFAAEKGSGLND